MAVAATASFLITRVLNCYCASVGVICSSRGCRTLFLASRRMLSSPTTVMAVLMALAGGGAGGPRVVGSRERTAAAVPAASGAVALSHAELVSHAHTLNINTSSRHPGSTMEMLRGEHQSTDGDAREPPNWLGGQRHATVRVLQSSRAPLRSDDVVDKTGSGATKRVATTTTTVLEGEMLHEIPAPSTRHKGDTLAPSETEVTTERVNGRWLVLLDVCVDHNTAVDMIASMCEGVGALSLPRAWRVSPR